MPPPPLPTLAQEVLDASLFEPGAWQPDVAKGIPARIPAPDRGAMATPAGLLFQVLLPLPSHVLPPLARRISTCFYPSTLRCTSRSSRTRRRR